MDIVKEIITRKYAEKFISESKSMDYNINYDTATFIPYEADNMLAFKATNFLIERAGDTLMADEGSDFLTNITPKEFALAVTDKASDVESVEDIHLVEVNGGEFTLDVDYLSFDGSIKTIQLTMGGGEFTDYEPITSIKEGRSFRDDFDDDEDEFFMDDRDDYYEDDDYYDDYESEEDQKRRMFANPGSALRRETRSNPRNLPCPTCGEPDRLTAKDERLGYQCDECADRAEGGGW